MPLQHEMHPSDWQGLARLAGDGVAGTSQLVEQLHRTIAGATLPLGPAVTGPTRGITGLVYRSVRGVNKVVGTAIDTVAQPIVKRLPTPDSSAGREQRLAALNGVLGDHLARTGNPLAIDMRFRQNGRVLDLEAAALGLAEAEASSHLLVSLHGLCMNDRHWQTRSGGPGLPARLARTHGASLVDLHYNTGRPIADNGRDFAGQLERLVENWPVPVDRITLIGHSMGGLVARSALAQAQESAYGWRKAMDGVVFLGTPHHGSPVERAGHRIDRLLGISPYSAPFTRLGQSRSAGITDLRHGLPADGEELGGLRCLAVAATARPAMARFGRVLGDGLVPVDSALGRQDAERTLPLAEDDCHLVAEAGHLGLLHSPRVYRILRRWLSA